jgi:hypothetical protein
MRKIVSAFLLGDMPAPIKEATDKIRNISEVCEELKPHLKDFSGFDSLFQKEAAFQAERLKEKTSSYKAPFSAVDLFDETSPRLSKARAIMSLLSLYERHCTEVPEDTVTNAAWAARTLIEETENYVEAFITRDPEATHAELPHPHLVRTIREHFHPSLLENKEDARAIERIKREAKALGLTVSEEPAAGAEIRNELGDC